MKLQSLRILALSTVLLTSSVVMLASGMPKLYAPSKGGAPEASQRPTDERARGAKWDLHLKDAVKALDDQTKPANTARRNPNDSAFRK